MVQHVSSIPATPMAYTLTALTIAGQQIPPYLPSGMSPATNRPHNKQHCGHLGTTAVYVSHTFQQQSLHQFLRFWVSPICVLMPVSRKIIPQWISGLGRNHLCKCVDMFHVRLQASFPKIACKAQTQVLLSDVRPSAATLLVFIYISKECSC